MPRAIIESPVGLLELASDGPMLTQILFHATGTPTTGKLPDVLDRTRDQLDRYFAGALTMFNLPLDPRGTPFQRAVWQALTKIPYGETTNYAEIASRIGRPTAVRAVGAANGQNPIPIVIPCHRVIGKNGALVGFGGGLETKRRLLDLERGRIGLFDEAGPGARIRQPASAGSRGV